MKSIIFSTMTTKILFLYLFCLKLFSNSYPFHISKSSIVNRLHGRLFCINDQKANGEIYLVGAGPGDPDLLTIQALKLIRNASIVISDRLVSKEILALVNCELRIANKRPGCAEEAQAELNRWAIDAALEGKKVVRLKIGDPFLFGRGGEEVLEYRKHGIEAKLVPGLSSSYAAPLMASIPLTHRGVSNQLLITTGYGKNSEEVEVPEFIAERTVVLLMAIGRIGKIAEQMVSKGFPVDTPVSIIERATTPRQRVISGTLKNIGKIAEEENAQPPATIVIGNVVNALL